MEGSSPQPILFKNAPGAPGSDYAGLDLPGIPRPFGSRGGSDFRDKVDPSAHGIVAEHAGGEFAVGGEDFDWDQ